MAHDREDIERLQKLLRSRFPELSNNEIEKRAENLLELGFFLVRLKIRNIVEQPKSQDADGSSKFVREPP